jgi:hypothetical protein
MMPPLLKFRSWLIQVGSNCHYCIFDPEKNLIFDKKTIKKPGAACQGFTGHKESQCKKGVNDRVSFR